MRKKKQFPWKQNFLRVPNTINRQIQKIANKQVIVACVKKIAKADITKGLYKHLKIVIEDDKASFPTNIVPSSSVGRYSATNIDGKESVRRDLPMVKKSYSWETPNFGDWSKGSHTTTRERDVYQRDYIPAKEWEIKIELLDTEIINGEEAFVFKFSIDDVFDASSAEFEADLLYALNLLQENTGHSYVFTSTTSREDFLKTVLVEWEILPPGEKDDVLSKISGNRSFTPEEKTKISDRYDLLSKLNPSCYIRGTSGFHRYFGAMFGENLVVFENLEYGNAIYVMFEDWKVLSKKSRIDLLKGEAKGFERIVHGAGWEGKLKTLVLGKKY
jgi:hypothetical protein